VQGPVDGANRHARQLGDERYSAALVLHRSPVGVLPMFHLFYTTVNVHDLTFLSTCSA
jgi:hypothetical protein